MAKILITGSSGFIAPHVVNSALKKNFKVYGIDKLDNDNKVEGCNYIKEDINNFDLSKIKNLDYIVHLAFDTNIPHSIKEPKDTTENNLLMTLNLLKQATENKIKKFIFSSTASLYGHNPIPWVENMLSDPLEPYGWQKLSGESLCTMWHKCYGLPTSTLRLYQVYGENQRKDTALALFIRLKKEKKPITLTETSPGSDCKTGRRDFIYVGDVADAFIANCESEKTGKGEIINIATGRMTSMQEVAETIGGEVKFIPKRGFEVESHQADLSQCNRLLNWKPKVNFLSWLDKFAKDQEKND
jgi:nucleoside-diphosphate-sugar epimerase